MSTTIDATLTEAGLVPGKEALAELDRPYLSPSTMNALATTCPASWAASRLLPRLDDPMSPAGTGTIVHAVMEDLFALPANQRTPERASALWRDKVGAERTKRPDVDEEAWATHFAAYDQAVAAVTDPAYTGEGEVASAVDVVGTEIPLGSPSAPVKVAGVPVFGIVDRLQRDSQGALHMRDYKLRGLKDGAVAPMPDAAHLERFGDDYGHQQRLYAMALTHLGYGGLASARLLYLGSRQWRDIDLSEEAMASTRARLTSTWARLGQMVDERLFGYSVGPLCRFCPLCEACPAAAGRTTRKGAPLDCPDPRRTQRAVPTMRRNMEDNATWGENRPYEAWAGELPNAAAWGAASAFGTVSLAWELIDATGVVSLNRSTVTATAAHLAGVVLGAASDVLGRPARWGDGAVTRCSGALRAYLASRPAPVGNDEAMEAWAAKARRAVVLMSTVAADLYTTNLKEDTDE